MSGKITFYSAWYCPFAQRTWVALEHLGLPYTYRETDPYHKSDHWLHLSRDTGQVPVLTVGNSSQSKTRIPGSLRTLEYLDDVRDRNGGLFPAGNLERAEARFWLDYQGAKIIPYFYRFLKADTGSAEAEAAQSEMLLGLAAITNAMSEAGPFFFGTEFSVVDIALVPFAFRIEFLLPHYKGYHLPVSGANWLRYQMWSRAVQAHPSFTATMPEWDTYKPRLLNFYLPYSQGGGQKDVTTIVR